MDLLGFSFRRPRWLGGRQPRHLDYVKLPSYGQIYFDHLIGEYDAMKCPETRDPEADRDAKSLKERYLKGERHLTWGDLCAFEGLLLRLRTASELREQVWAIEARYKAIAAGAEYEDHAKLAPLDAKTASEDELRSRIQVLLSELYRLYMVTACCEDMRKVASCSVSIVLVIFLVLFFVAEVVSERGFPRGGPFEIPTLPAICFAGAVGGFISAQRRLQSVSKRGESLIDLIELSSKSGYWLAPLTGAVFAIVLYLLFVAKLLKPPLFPTIATPSIGLETGMPFRVFAVGTGPSTGLDWGLLLIWSFIAGFAERFVPDALDRLVARTQETSKNTQT